MVECLNEGHSTFSVGLLTPFITSRALQTQEKKPAEMPPQPLKTESLAPPPAADIPDKQPEKPSPPSAKASNTDSPAAECPF